MTKRTRTADISLHSFMYDPDRHIKNPAGLVGDIEGKKGKIEIMVVLRPHKVLEKAAAASGVLAARLLQPFAAADLVRAALEEIRHTNRDPHLLYSQVSLALALIPESTVREAFVTMWAEFSPSERDEMLAPLQSLLPTEPVEASVGHG